MTSSNSQLDLPILDDRPTRVGSIATKRQVTVDSPEEYAHIVAGHANPSSTAQSLYSGANYANFATYLERPYQPTATIASGLSPETPKPFVTLHDLSLPESDETRIHGFCSVDAFAKSIEEKQKQAKPSLLVFLRGHPSPQWLNTIGYLCNVDPEFLLRHLNFRTPPTERHFTSPAPPSTTSNIIQLRISSIVCREQTNETPDAVSQLRIEAAEEMKEYHKNLKKEIGVKTGDSIVRSFVVHDNEHSTLEQDISLCVNEFGKGWIGVVWLDHGNDLSEGPVGPWSYLKERSQSWKTFIIPTILYRPGIALKTPYISARQVQQDQVCPKKVLRPLNYHQLACTIHAHYGRFLDEKAAGVDAFYAMNELFVFAATSESQFLNMVEQKIVIEMDNLLDNEKSKMSPNIEPPTTAISNLLYNKKVLDEHIRHLKENKATIENSGSSKWPKATEEEADIFSKVRITRNMLLKDYDYLLERAKTLSRSCDRGIDIAGNNAMVAESRSAIRQAEWVSKLTLLAFFFIPASFTTSLFGMNFSQFGQGPLGIWIWAVVLVPTYMVSLFVLYFDFRRINLVGHFFNTNILRRRYKEQGAA